jgi:hypothetical protein
LNFLRGKKSNIAKIGNGKSSQVREDIRPYIGDFDAENSKIALKNTYEWDIFSEFSNG